MIVFNLNAVLKHPGDLVFCTISGLVVILALYLMVGRFWMDAWLRTRESYWVTSERVMILSGPDPTGLFRGPFLYHLKVLRIREIDDILIEELPTGIGTIIFGKVKFPDSWDCERGTRRLGMPKTPRFERIDESRRIYDLICNLRRDGGNLSRVSTG